MNSTARGNVVIRLIEANALLSVATGLLLLCTIAAIAFHFLKKKRG